jgi:cyclophilin family peptidyl-prolyl cis-trans isomerase
VLEILIITGPGLSCGHHCDVTADSLTTQCHALDAVNTLRLDGDVLHSMARQLCPDTAHTPHAFWHLCRALEFLITTGPGPVPRLDGINPVIGRVESGMDTVIRLSKVSSQNYQHTACVMAHGLPMCIVGTPVCMWSMRVAWIQSSGCHRSL